MLIGVHILRDHPRGFDADTVHSAIYSVSAIAATVIMTLVLYNGYHIRYHKGIQWNLRTMDTVGTGLLSIVGMLSLSQRLCLVCYNQLGASSLSVLLRFSTS